MLRKIRIFFLSALIIVCGNNLQGQNINGEYLKGLKNTPNVDVTRVRQIELLYSNKIDSLIKFSNSLNEISQEGINKKHFGLLMAYGVKQNMDSVTVYTNKLLDIYYWDNYGSEYPLYLLTDYFCLCPIIDNAKYRSLVENRIVNYYKKAKNKNTKAGIQLIKLLIKDQSIREASFFCDDKIGLSKLKKDCDLKFATEDNKVQNAFLKILKANKGLFYGDDVGSIAVGFEKLLIWHNSDIAIRKDLLIPYLEKAFTVGKIPFDSLCNQIIRTDEIEGKIKPWQTAEYNKRVAEIAKQYNYTGSIDSINYFGF